MSFFRCFLIKQISWLWGSLVHKVLANQLFSLFWEELGLLLTPGLWFFSFTVLLKLTELLYLCQWKNISTHCFQLTSWQSCWSTKTMNNQLFWQPSCFPVDTSIDLLQWTFIAAFSMHVMTCCFFCCDVITYNFVDVWTYEN